MSEHREAAQSPTSSDPTLSSARGGFLGFVAHEMRNPLSTALWSAELLARLSSEDRAGARGEKLAGMCLRALQKLRFLVEDHFLAERLDVAGIPLRLEPVSLREALAGMAAKAGLDLSIAIEPDLVVSADRGLLDRALDGLLAVANRGKGTKLRAEGKRSGDSALLKISGEPPAADALDPPHKGTASDPTGRALALHMALRVALTLEGELSTAPDGYLLRLPLDPSAAIPRHD